MLLEAAALEVDGSTDGIFHVGLEDTSTAFPCPTTASYDLLLLHRCVQPDLGISSFMYGELVPDTSGMIFHSCSFWSSVHGLNAVYNNCRTFFLPTFTCLLLLLILSEVVHVLVMLNRAPVEQQLCQHSTPAPPPLPPHVVDIVTHGGEGRCGFEFKSVGLNEAANHSQR